MEYLQAIFTSNSDYNPDCGCYLYMLIPYPSCQETFLGKNTGFDIVLLVILGSVLSCARNGSAQHIQTIAASLVIIVLPWLVSFLITRSSFIANLMEGLPEQIIKEGKINRKMMRNSHLREQNILESARLRGNISDLSQIEESYL